MARHVQGAIDAFDACNPSEYGILPYPDASQGEPSKTGDAGLAECIVYGDTLRDNEENLIVFAMKLGRELQKRGL